MTDDNDAGMVERHAERRADSDHDLLIRIDTRLDGLERDVGEIKSDTVATIATMDVRVRGLEDLTKLYDPVKLTPRYEATAVEWDRFKGRWLWIVGLVALGAAIVGDVLNVLAKLVHLASPP